VERGSERVGEGKDGKILVKVGEKIRIVKGPKISPIQKRGVEKLQKIPTTDKID